jgi:putative sterol carrier protein
MLSSVRDLFAEIPSQFDPAAWGQEDAVLQFNISGDGGGSWIAEIVSGALTISEGQAAKPSMTMTCASQDMLAIVNGELSAVSAFMQGRVKIDGNMALAMKLQNLLKT